MKMWNLTANDLILHVILSYRSPSFSQRKGFGAIWGAPVYGSYFRNFRSRNLRHKVRGYFGGASVIIESLTRP